MLARSLPLALTLGLLACGGAPHASPRPPVGHTPAPTPAGKLTTDPDLNRQPPPKLLAIDWANVELTSDADALALWERIAPTGADWEAKLDELPDDGPLITQLALAMLRAGNFTCAAPTPVPAARCAPPPADLEPPAATATLADPCLRRILAMWSIASLDAADLPTAHAALRAIAAIPPPESQLVAAALEAVPADDQAFQLELRAIAFAAGHRELVNGKLGALDAPHLVEAVRKHHIDGALEILSVESQRPVYLAAVNDELLATEARTMAITELITADDVVGKDVRDALTAATRATRCEVAAFAARTLVRLGIPKAGPARPRTKKPAAMMRGLCVVASYEDGLRADEPSFLPSYVPKRGLELVTIDYDPYSETDDDGDGDPHTTHTTVLVPHDEVTLPNVEDLVHAFDSCTGTTCRSNDREYRFVFRPGAGGELFLSRLEVAEQPPCPSTK